MGRTAKFKSFLTISSDARRQPKRDVRSCMPVATTRIQTRSMKRLQHAETSSSAAGVKLASRDATTAKFYNAEKVPRGLSECP